MRKMLKLALFAFLASRHRTSIPADNDNDQNGDQRDHKELMEYGQERRFLSID